MDFLKGMGSAVLIIVALITIPLIILIGGLVMTLLGPVLAIVLFIGLPCITIGVIIGVREAHKNKGD